MNYEPRIVVYDDMIGIATGTKMDPNYIIVNTIVPIRQTHLVLHKNNLTLTSLLPSDLDGITTFAEFQQAYPEYCI